MKKMIILILTTALAELAVTKNAEAQDWRPLPGGSPNARVIALTKFDGYLWVGGLFTQTGAISAQSVVRHNGSQWVPTPGLPNTPFGFAVYNNELYALGGFDVGNQRFGVMKWTGSGWLPMARIDSWGIIKCGVVFGNKLILGGQFFSVDGIASESLISYDGSSWSSFGGPISCFWIWPARVNAIHIANGFLYIAGSFDQIGGIASGCAVKTNGTFWSNLSISWNTYASALGSIGNDVFVGGIFYYAGASTSFRVAKEGVGGWINASNGVQMNVFASATYQNKVYIAGSVAPVGGDYVGNCCYWNGSNWTRDDSGIKSGMVSVLFTDQADDILYAGGDFKTVNGDTADYIAYKSESTLGEVGLPVNLTSFDCKYEDESFVFLWQTETEINASYFSLSVSSDATHYEEMAIIQAHGNSSQTNYYSMRIIEEEFSPEITESPRKYFRLAQYDFDGTLSGEWNCVKELKRKSAEIVYDTARELVVCEECNDNIYIFNSSGKMVKEGLRQISTEGLAFGLYIARTTSKESLHFGVRSVNK